MGLRLGAIPRILRLIQLLLMVEIDSCKKQLANSNID